MKNTNDLEHGFEIPSVGLGTLMISKKLVPSTIQEAIRAGCRLFDCAPAYRNEAYIGEALRDIIESGKVRREELLIVSKIFNTHHFVNGEDRPRESVLKTLKDMKLEQLDLLLMHWPLAFTEKVLPRPFRDKQGRPNPQIGIVEEYLDTWKSMEQLKEDGLVKNIGVCNFKKEQLEEILNAGLTIPAVNQIELHPYLQQKELVEFCKERNITLMAHSPLGSQNKTSWPIDIGTSLRQNKTIASIAKRHKKTISQVLIRWSIRSGFICIPRSTNKKHIQENMATLDGWELDDEAMQEINSLDRNFRYCIGFVPGHYDGPNAPW